MSASNHAGLAKKYPGKRAFITGAGSGLGLAFATELAKSEWEIGLADVQAELLETAAQKISQAGGIPTTYHFDVAKYDDFKAAVNDFALRTGGIDIGINNAGVGCGGRLEEVPIETFEKVISINLMGVVNGCHLFAPIMKRQKCGHILNIASAAGFVSAPRMSAYNTSKAGVIALSETLRSELAEDQVLVTVLMPTYVRTNIGINAEGTETDRKFAQYLVERAKLDPAEVARTTLSKMETGELYVVLPAEARYLWRFKRYFPENFRHFILREVQRYIAKQNQKSS